MRGALVWLVVAGCGFAPNGADPDASAPGGGSGSDAGTIAIDAAHAAPDAATSPDASTLDALVCPSGSGWFQVSGETSWYFEASTSAKWTDAETQCEALQLAGGSAIHLAVLSTQTELAAVAGHDTQHDFWIGMFQPEHQATPAAGWLWITGGDGIAGAWAPGEPNDDGGFFSRPDYENDDEDFAELYASSSTLNDSSNDTDFRYLCECDGVAVPAAIRNQIP